MKKVIFFLIGLLCAGVIRAQLTSDKAAFLGGFYSYSNTLCSPGYFRLPHPEEIIRMPVLDSYPDAATQLDSLIKKLREGQKSLDWALDSLRPGSGPAVNLPDWIRKMMIFYLYADQLKAMDKPLKIRYYSVNRNPFIVGGAGIPEKGYISLACLTAVGEGYEYGGPLVVAWAATQDTVMGSTRAIEAFNRAVGEGILVSLFDNHKWSKPSSVVRCAAPFYGRPAYRIRARVTYDYKFEPERQMRVSDSYYVFVLVKGGYEYLVAFLADGGCFHPENVADFLSLRP